MKHLLVVALLSLSGVAHASEPVDQLNAHLKEMKNHLAFVEKLDQADYQCADLVERVKRMTHHMEMMTDMMIRMHAGKSDHEMSHGTEGDNGT